MPKSAMRGRLSRSSSTFPGFKSRCTTPCACSAESALAIGASSGRAQARSPKRAPLLHGSYLSEVCSVCGAFRALSHLPPHDPIQGGEPGVHELRARLDEAPAGVSLHQRDRPATREVPGPLDGLLGESLAAEALAPSFMHAATISTTSSTSTSRSSSARFRSSTTWRMRESQSTRYVPPSETASTEAQYFSRLRCDAILALMASWFQKLFGPSKPARLSKEEKAKAAKERDKRDLRDAVKMLQKYERDAHRGSGARMAADAKKIYGLSKGRIVFPTATARAIWIVEILGQLSDGMWENAAEKFTVQKNGKWTQPDEETWNRVGNHFLYWYALTPVVGRHAEAVVNKAPSFPKKIYDPKEFEWLVDVLGSRMIAAARAALPPEKASTYSLVDLHADVRSIQTAMASAWKKTGRKVPAKAPSKKPARRRVGK